MRAERESGLDVRNQVDADSCLLRHFQVAIFQNRDMVNHVNRRVNFENANLSRTVDAAIVQVEAREKIERTVGLESLPVPLAEMAKLRRDNPEVSLSELADMTDPPLTRSGVNHRLKRLVEIAGGIGG